MKKTVRSTLVIVRDSCHKPFHGFPRMMSELEIFEPFVYLNVIEYLVFVGVLQH